MTTPSIRAASGSRAASPLGPKTWDAERRTIDIEVASETPCPSYRFKQSKDGMLEPFEVKEVLVASGCVNVGSPRGVCLVNSHDYSNIDKVLGVLTDVRVEGKKVVATARLSGREEVRKFDADFANDTIPNISAGYAPLTEDDPVDDPEGGPPIVRVKTWELLEASFVTVPADRTVKSRSHAMTTKPPVEANANDAETVSVGAVRSILQSLGIVGARGKREDETEDKDGKDGKGGDGERGKRGDDDSPETADERAARMKARKAKREADEADEMRRRESDEPDDEKVSEDERKKRKAQRDELRPIAVRHGAGVDFDNFVKTGATIAELRSFVTAAMATGGGEKKEFKGDAGGARSLPAFGETFLAKRSAR